MENVLRILYIGKIIENIDALNASKEISITTKNNSLDAVNFLKTGNEICAIICEMHLSGWNGMEIHEWVRSQEHFNKIPFVLVSYEFKDHLFRTAFEKHVDDFYIMPLPSADNIIGRIRFLIEYRKKNDFTQPEVEQEINYRMPLSKRIFDIVVASSALIVLSPFLLCIIGAIWLESKGRVYYISKRVGREPFDFYKLRSMRVGADAELNKLAKDKNQYASSSSRSDIDFTTSCPRCRELPADETCSPILHIGPHAICDYWYTYQKREMDKSKSAFIKIVNDPRITKVGKIIRNTSVDELPQLINVIKGDMSIVGNRPLPIYEAEQLTKDYLSKRFLAPAGITGLWQVELRGKGGLMSEDERKRLDNEYADHFTRDNYSFWYDLKLILRTFPALFQKDTV
jgi:lipopolysaccharide/colanic/teichoic acid biosynthesis glycosyltransferase/CheY-like chemotaxis protein